MEQLLQAIWYRWRYLGWLLLPLAVLFLLLSTMRRYWLKRHQSTRLAKPIIVVGNITVGGSGKTPLLMAIVEQLQQQGLRPGVISRGYGGRPPAWPYRLNADSTAAEAGDEPLMIYQRCRCPVVVAPDRLQAAHYLLAQADVDVIISDDGLQHYRLPRDIEIVVIDGQRGLGNGLCLPAGPLRELPSRLAQADMVVVNGAENTRYHQRQYTMQLQPGELQPLPTTRAAAPASRDSLHALAGIAHPERFFVSLEQLGYCIERHPFADHYAFSPDDVLFNDAKPVIMTEKDAVKCQRMPGLDRHWYLPVKAQLPDRFWQQLQQQLQQCCDKR